MRSLNCELGRGGANLVDEFRLLKCGVNAENDTGSVSVLVCGCLLAIVRVADPFEGVGARIRAAGGADDGAVNRLWTYFER